MNYDDILALVRAGYSKTEIDAMAAGAAAPTPVPSAQQPAAPEQPKEAPAPAVPPAQQSEAPEQPKEAPAPAVPPQAQPVAATSTEALLQQLFGSVNTLTQAVQAQNRATITGTTPAQTTEEIARNATARMMGVTEKE